MKVVFNFGFLIDDKIAAEIVHYSHELCEKQEAVYVLGEQSLPHITVLQFEEDLAKAHELWERLSSFAQSTQTVEFRGIVLDRWRDWDVIWFKVTRPSWLMELQRTAIKHLPSYSFVNGTGDHFEPHVTLGAWMSQAKMSEFRIAPNLINLKNVSVRLTLGKSGPNFQYAEALYQ